jgi:glutamate-ammonia-ligase adenylyltransferase
LPFSGLPKALVQLLKARNVTDSELNKIKQLARVSDFALDVITRQPELISRLDEPLQTLQLPASQEDQWPAIIRRWRSAQSCKLIWRDIAEIDTVQQTLQGSTYIAEQALSVAFDAILQSMQRVHGVVRNEAGQEQYMVVLGLGKLGGGELNFSSDVDLVYAFTGHGMSDGERSIAAETYFTRLGQRLANLLDDVTADGFSHRVDLRLRPFGASGRLLLSFNAMEQYFQTSGRDWERYAWLKARPVAGHIESGLQLLEQLRPFVYRRYLDFTAIDGLREMKSKIEKEVQRRDVMNDLKLGRGGIREIEFFVQAMQIIYGGRTKSLQLKGLLPSLYQLQHEQLITEIVRQQLEQAYLYLRRVENRVQMIADAQIHRLPDAEKDRERFALALGYCNWVNFSADLQAHRDTVEQLFADLLAAPEQRSSSHQIETGELTAEYLMAIGFQNFTRHAERLNALLEGGATSALSDKSQSRMHRVAYQFVQLSAGAVNADQCLDHAISFLQSIVKRGSYIALLDEQHSALSRVVQVFDESLWLSQLLINHPLLLDELLDTRVMGQRFHSKHLSEQLTSFLAQHADDTELTLLALNEFKISYTFKIAYHFLFQQLSASIASRLLTLLAEQILIQCNYLAEKELAIQHGIIEGSSFAIIGYGSLGASTLAFNSDLDLVFLNQSEQHQVSNGTRELDSPRFFLRHTQKLISLLGLSTPSGSLYEIDIRLRPDGAKGLLVSSMDSFEQYQLQRAWVWELQALVRARAVAGNADLQKRFELLREKLLCMPRDADNLKNEIIAMRHRMRVELNRSSERMFDLKHGYGGLTDIEFFLQAQILTHAFQYPILTQKRETVAIISCLQEANILSQVHAGLLIDAYENLLNLGLSCHLNNTRRVVESTEQTTVMTISVNKVLATYGYNFAE